ncbi:MAG: ankyrin repeat domain-containing protein [Acetobacter aceti]|nr:ankyrin repeat domain-containing protein [Acetobacter aceti]
MSGEKGRSDILPMYGAVMESDIDAVRLLAEKHQNLDERNPDDNSTPMIAAAATDQWPVVEILIDHGANIWAHSEFGDTAASYILDSRILKGSKEDQARMRVIEKLKAQGYPFPSPDPDEILILDKDGKWPPPGAKR